MSSSKSLATQSFRGYPSRAHLSSRAWGNALQNDVASPTLRKISTGVPRSVIVVFVIAVSSSESDVLMDFFAVIQPPLHFSKPCGRLVDLSEGFLWEIKVATVQGGVEACFVNLGSDHPSLIEAMVRGQKERRDRFPKIYTCPSEVSQARSCIYNIQIRPRNYHQNRLHPLNSRLAGRHVHGRRLGTSDRTTTSRNCACRCRNPSSWLCLTQRQQRPGSRADLRGPVSIHRTW